jgi:sulfate adenylyltransferase (ADP) / ATP adenylyltransferase
MFENNASVVLSQTYDVTIEQRDIPFNVQVMQAWKKAVDDPAKRTHGNQPRVPEVRAGGFRKSDKFLEPFEDGICIEDNLSKTHRLIFNKYPSRKHHVLVITKEREQQGDLLNARDFEASIKAMKALDGFLFYNSDAVAGASERHKHLQVIPVSSLPNKRIPINEKVVDTIKRSQAPARAQD